MDRGVLFKSSIVIIFKFRGSVTYAISLQFPYGLGPIRPQR